MTFQLTSGLLHRLRRRLEQERIERAFARYRKTRPLGYKLFSTDKSLYSREFLSHFPKCDVVNLHWVARWIDYATFFGTIPQRVPVVWTLHDMNPFTGGCHYDDGCGRYVDGCGCCPQLGSLSPADLSHWVWRRKQRIFQMVSPEQVHIVCPSCWMADESKKSPLLNRFPISIIPNGLDTEAFLPLERTVAREALNVPQDAEVVLFVAELITSHRKGFGLLAKSLGGLRDRPNLFLLSIGSGEPRIEATISHLHLKSIEHDRLLALVYSAADIFVIPSLQDNLPNTVMEAMACGVPVVGFDVGGIREMVQPGVTGLLVSVSDVRALREAILCLLDDPGKRAEMSANCRRIAVEEYALAIQVRRYAALYQTMISRQREKLRIV